MVTKLAVIESTGYSYQSEDRGNIIGSWRRNRMSRQVYRTRTRGYTGNDLDDPDSEDKAGCGRTERKVKQVDTQRYGNSKK